LEFTREIRISVVKKPSDRPASDVEFLKLFSFPTPWILLSAGL